MVAFYEQLEKILETGKGDSKVMAVTVLTGNLFGEKALVYANQLLWTSKEDAFFARYITQLEQAACSGVCIVGGERLYFELVQKEKQIVICGGGHVSLPLIRMGRMIGCEVTVLEDRQEFAAHAEQAGASHVICAPFKEGLAHICGDPGTFFVIVTRGHQYDAICLEQIVKKPHAYIGMIGSKNRTAAVRAAVKKTGAPADAVDRVYAPIGLSIGAQTPEEIAVAIIAQIISVKNSGKETGGYPKAIRQAILSETGGKVSGDCQKVLATIISRFGSAPRGVGTKMLVRADSTCIGTLGGGIAEARIRGEALDMLQSGSAKHAALCQVDLTAAVAQADGMICGGSLEVLLEVV